MANENGLASFDNPTPPLHELSPDVAKPAGITLSASSDDATRHTGNSIKAILVNGRNGDSQNDMKRKLDQLDSCDDSPRSPKKANAVNRPQQEAIEVEADSKPVLDPLAIVENNLRIAVSSMPPVNLEVDQCSESAHEDMVLCNGNSRAHDDGVSSGLSSPRSSSSSDEISSSQYEPKQGAAQEIDQAGGTIPPSSLNTVIELDDMYSKMKACGRFRKKPEIFGDPVPTVLAVEDEETAALEDSVQPTKDPQKLLPRARKKSTAAAKQSGQLQNVGRLVRAEKAKHIEKNAARDREEDREKKILRSLKGTTAVRQKPNKQPIVTTKPQQKLSKEDEDARLRRLASASPLGRWMLETSRRFENKDVPIVFTIPLPELDLEMLALSEKMTRRDALEDKPNPQGQPAVWSPSRQAMCETLAYFKSPQSGCYQNDGHIYGFLFDSIGHCREYMDEDVIICRAGGSMESDGPSGMVQRKDHSVDEAQVKAVLNDMAHHNPTIVICGNRNVAAPCSMPQKYCVLGWYKPTLVWSEKTAGKGGKIWTTIKYRLERLNSDIPAWHAPNEPLLTEEERVAVGEVLTKTCGTCHSSFPQIYLGGWMCLNEKCAKFWKFHGAIEAPCGNEQSLSYHPAFLTYKSERWSECNGMELEPAPMRPPVPDVGHAIGDNLTYINTRGICCPKCGRCNSRRLFKGWICETPYCDFELSAMHRPISPAMLHTPWDMAQTLVRNRKQPSVSLDVVYKYGYKLSIYTFHGIPGCLIHASATKPVIEEERGPDDMFANMQVVDMGLERRTFVTKKASANCKNGVPDRIEATPDVSTENDEEGPELAQESIDGDSGPSEKKAAFAEGDLMTAFSMNYGMPYKFVASGGSKPFEDGPWPVIEARRRLNWAVRAFLNKPEEDMDLNEELIFAYLESQKLEYHDDGEKGLGPRIATLSLGGKAKMPIRMKTKHYVGCSKQGILVEEKPIAGSLEYEKRLQAWTDLQELKTTDSPAYNRRRKEIPKELGLYDKRMKKAEDLVTITLSHGDIVIMDGYDIQKYLEHKVVSEGYLRFALTCRTVLENHLKPEERPDYEVKVDEQTYDGPKV